MVRPMKSARLFCKGRYEAFIAEGFEPKQFPAASALGHAKPIFQVYVIASKQANQHFENPDQVSAYDYPRQYGPKALRLLERRRRLIRICCWFQVRQVLLGMKRCILAMLSIN